jgi:HD-GYP domain-containing protein (c-di-GMP phosphodiesterase class II)
MRLSATYDLLAFPLIFFFAFIYSRFGPELSAALALPMLGMRQLYKTNVALQKINEELLQLMVAAIEARDPYTSGHSQRVARYAKLIAKSAGLGSRTTERVMIAALLHDVGKIYEEFAPILRKPGRLTDDEFEVMKTHASRGSALVCKVSHFEDLVPMVQSHHESWDGRGYPDGVSGDAIPTGARVIALADTIDAMSTSRPYRPALSESEVRAELERESGRQFDPRICKALLNDTTWAMLRREIALAIEEHPVNTDLSIVIEQLAPGNSVLEVRA